MTETFIESAMMALSGAWNNDTVVVSCQPLTEALQAVAAGLSQLRTEVGVLKDSVEHLRNQQESTAEDVAKMRDRMITAEEHIEAMTTDTTGFVQRLELQEECASMKQRIDTSVRAEADKMQAAIDGLRTNVHETDAVAVYTRDNLQSHSEWVKTELAMIRADAAGTKDQEHTHYVELSKALTAAHNELHATDERLTLTIEGDRTRADDAINEVRIGATTDLQTNTSEILDHLKTQAAAIDDLRRKHDERVAAMPTRTEVDEMRKSLEQSRLAVDEAQYRLSEAFSQCMGMMSSSVGGGAASRSIAASPARTGGGSKPSGAAASLLGAVPLSMEVQLDVMRRDIAKLQDTVVPECVATVKTLSNDTRRVAGALRRGEELAAALCECLGLGDGDEIRASLFARDHHRTVVLLRRSFNVLASNQFTLGNASGTGTSSTPGTPRRSTKKSSHAASVGPDDSPRGRDNAMSTEMDTVAEGDVPSSSGVFIPPSVWRDKNVPPSEAKLREKDPTRFTPPSLGMDLADAVGGAIGANVMLVQPRGVAATCGIQPGDRIIKVNGERCDDCAGFVQLLQNATRHAVIQHHSGGETSGGPTVSLDMCLIGAKSHQTRHVTIRARVPKQ